MAKNLLKRLQAHPAEMVALLREFVELESPSFNKAPVDHCGQRIAQAFERIGGRVIVHRQAKFGDHLQIEFGGQTGQPVMLLGHFDTVWDVGTLAKMPWTISGGRAHGPGSFDMKGGIVLMVHALAALKEESGGVLPRPVRVWLVTDEEIGSESSRATTEKFAKECAAVLVCEPAHHPGAALKTARKGVGDYTIKVSGVSAHAGLAPEKGHSAILELARQIQVISKFNDQKRGFTVNPGVVRGGTRTNVIAADAEVEVDVRIARLKDAGLADQRFHGLRPFDKKCKLTVTGGVNRPPMERSAAVAALFALAQKEAKAIGFKLRETSTGGGSDGNFTAALGVPTLDGMGAVGDGAHAVHEHVRVAELPRRAALLAAMIQRAGRG